VRLGAIKDLLEFDVEVDEVLFDALEHGNVLVHEVQLLVGLLPLKIVEPLSWIRLLVDLSTRSSKEESPFSHVDLIISEEDLHCQKEREEKFVHFEERSAHVLVK